MPDKLWWYRCDCGDCGGVLVIWRCEWNLGLVGSMAELGRIGDVTLPVLVAAVGERRAVDARTCTSSPRHFEFGERSSKVHPCLFPALPLTLEYKSYPGGMLGGHGALPRIGHSICAWRQVRRVHRRRHCRRCAIRRHACVCDKHTHRRRVSQTTIRTLSSDARFVPSQSSYPRLQLSSWVRVRVRVGVAERRV